MGAFLHTGEALGLAGQTLAGTRVCSGCPAGLDWSILALRRFMRWRVRANNSASEAAAQRIS